MKTPGFAGGLLLIAFQTTGSDNDFATVSYMRAGSYTAHITARDASVPSTFPVSFTIQVRAA